MSTPSGKPFDPIRISDYAPKRVRDRLATSDEREHRDEPDSPSAWAPEASLAAQPGRGAEDWSAAPLAPNASHERAAAEWDRSDDDGIGRPGGEPLVSGGEGSEESAYFDVEAAYCDDTTVRRAFKARSAEYEVDLQRLEADLLALQGKAGERGGRLPPASQLPPVRGLRPSNDVYIDGFRVPRSLEPSFLPPPPMREGTNHTGAVLRVLGACALAAPIAYFLVYYFSTVHEPWKSARGPKLSTLETQVAALPPMPAREPEAAPSLPATEEPKQSQAEPPHPPAPARYVVQSAAPAWPAPRETSGGATAWANPTHSPAVSPASAPVPSPDSSPVPSQTPSPPAASRPAPTIDRDEIAILLEQGEQFISAGDVVQARVLFERAAEAGDGTAALALAATYDSAVLVKLGVRGIVPDDAKAHRWYQKAQEFGSPEPPTWLAKLADR